MNKRCFTIPFMIALLWAGFSTASRAEGADAFTLGLPVECTIGSDCWVVNYADHDTSEAALDHMCKARTNDTHQGTDFAVKDLLAMQNGVNVVAAAGGRVVRVRDGVEDLGPTMEERQAMFDNNKGCGNGVVVEHKDGWQTLYCHLKKESIIVEEGQRVRQGDTLAQIGYSGFTEFPHLHFGVLLEGQSIDPFTGTDLGQGCGTMARPLWATGLEAGSEAGDALKYRDFEIYAYGFAANPPDFEAIKIDTASPRVISQDAQALVFWSAFYGVKKGDEITLEIKNPDGSVYAQSQNTQEKTRARQFYFVGKRNRAQITPGLYTASVTLKRAQSEGQDPLEETRTATINVPQ